jgi:hypothetical protein
MVGDVQRREDVGTRQLLVAIVVHVDEELVGVDRNLTLSDAAFVVNFGGQQGLDSRSAAQPSIRAIPLSRPAGVNPRGSVHGCHLMEFLQTEG